MQAEGCKGLDDERRFAKMKNEIDTEWIRRSVGTKGSLTYVPFLILKSGVQQ